LTWLTKKVKNKVKYLFRINDWGVHDREILATLQDVPISIFTFSTRGRILLLGSLELVSGFRVRVSVVYS
jgi:hypothetical protein